MHSTPLRSHWIRTFLLFSAPLVLLTGCLSPEEKARNAVFMPPPPESGEPMNFPFVVRTNYHGWKDAIVLNNGRVEAVIVPEIGRIMQFRFAGAEDGPFWENAALYGKSPEAESEEWMNFGGDKAWPAPQADWQYKTPRSWPPPVAFDAAPVTAGIRERTVTLTSPIDPYYGIRVIRTIRLELDRPVMKVTTTFEKVYGDALLASIWVVTQLKDPLTAFARIPDPSIYVEKYNLQSEELPPDLVIGQNWISLSRNPRTPHKIGTDSGTLIWVGRDYLLRIDSPREPNLPGQRYPDQGSSAEIYTNADPLPYVELEMLGPLRKMIEGDRISRSSTYTLQRRREADPHFEVEMMMAH